MLFSELWRDLLFVKRLGYFGRPDDLLPFSLNNHG